MKKGRLLLFTFITSLFLVTTSLAASVDFENAYGQGQKDEVIYNTIQFDYCVVTGLTDQEADDVFAKLDEYDQSTTELVEDVFPDCNSTNDLEGTILYLQSNYESAKNAMTGHEEELDAYLLFNSIEYYKDNYDCIEQRVEDAQTASATASNGSTVATVKIFSDGSGDNTIGSSGHAINTGTHAWIVVENTSNRTIMVGKRTLPAGKQITLGTWGNKSEHTGLWYNLESYFIKTNSAYSKRVSTNYNIDSSGLDTLNTYILRHDYWNVADNCSAFASGAWNQISPNKISAGIICTPYNLAHNIQQTNYTSRAAVKHDDRVYYSQLNANPALSAVYVSTNYDR